MCTVYIPTPLLRRNSTVYLLYALTFGTAAYQWSHLPLSDIASMLDNLLVLHVSCGSLQIVNGSVPIALICALRALCSAHATCHIQKIIYSGICTYIFSYPLY